MNDQGNDGESPRSEDEAAWRARFDALARALDGVVYRRDAAGQWHWQGSLAQLIGRAPRELAQGGDGWLAQVHTDEREAVAQAYARRERDHATLDLEYRVGHALGSHRWVREQSRFVEIDGAYELVGTLRDISAQREADNERVAAERRLRQLADNLPAIVFATDADANVVFTNRRWADYTGLPVESARDWTETVHPDDRELVTSTWRRAIEQVTPYRYEVRRRRHDGAWRWWLTQAEPQLDSDGAIVAWIGSSLDIQDVREAQERLRETEQRLQLALHAANLVTWSWDADTGLLLTSDNAADVLGYRPDKIGAGWDYVDPEDVPHVRAVTDDAMRVGGSFVVAYRHRRPDTGEQRWLELHAQVTLDADGQPMRYQGVTLDVTERMRGEEALRQSEHRFRTLADTAPVLIWTSTPDGQADWFNKPWLDFTGRQLEQDVAAWIELVHPDDRNRIRSVLDAAYAERKPFAVQYRLRRRDGAWRWLLDNGHPRHDEHGTFLGYIGSCTDISDQKAGEEALREADRRKDEFLATLGHELRNPLAPLRNAVHILKRQSQQPPPEALLGIMDRQLNHLVRLVDDLLEVSRITRGKVELKRERIDLRQVARSAVELARPLIEHAKHTLDVVLPETPVWVDGDPVRLEQVVANLLNNATKYSDDQGYIRIAVESEGSEALLRVCDRGVGIPPEMLPKIFEMFTQVDRAARRGQGGLGIGLSLVRMLVTMHEGRVEAHSEGAGKGTTFTIALPLAAPPRTQVDELIDARRGAEADAAHATPLRGRRVLIVDDNRDAVESLAALVSALGAEVRLAYDGPEALECAREFQPAAVLLDIGLPGMDGYEVARQLRKRADGRPLLLIAVTGWGQQEDRRASHAAGFDLHLVKPANFATLQSALSALEPEATTT